MDKSTGFKTRERRREPPGDSGCTKERFCNTPASDRLTRGVSKNPVEQAKDGNGQQNN